MAFELDRRSLITGGLALAATACTKSAGEGPASVRAADVRLRIAPHRLELAPGVEYSTFAYNGQVPGPLIRLSKDGDALFEIENATSIPELVHWHGLAIPSDVDGAAEEGTPEVAPFGTQRYRFAPGPSGTHWYHTHAMGAKVLTVGAYTGLFGFFIVDGSDPGHYDQEVLVAMHHWGPKWVSGRRLRPDDPQHGLEVSYDHGTMNGRLMGHHEPVRVKARQRVLFRLLNASATENTWTSLAGHKMRVIALDGQAVPRQRDIDVLLLGPGERADVIVEMNNPGKWVLGAAVDAEREAGMGMIVEYADAFGDARWLPVKRAWDFNWFSEGGECPEPDSRIAFRIGRIAGGPEGYNVWKLNGKAWPDHEPLRVKRGKRYRLAISNETDHGHPMHLHRHHFEVARYHGKSCAGLIKDTINVRPHSSVELDFLANNPGPTLIHCHQAKHQDFGLMALMLYEGDAIPYGSYEAMKEAMQAYCRPPRLPA